MVRPRPGGIAIPPPPARSPTNLNLAKPGPLVRSANSKQCIKLRVCVYTRMRSSLNAKPSVCSHGDFRDRPYAPCARIHSFVRCAAPSVYAHSSRRVRTSGGCPLGRDIARTAPRDGYFAGKIKFVNTRSRIDPVSRIRLNCRSRSSNYRFSNWNISKSSPFSHFLESAIF